VLRNPPFSLPLSTILHLHPLFSALSQCHRPPPSLSTTLLPSPWPNQFAHRDDKRKALCHSHTLLASPFFNPSRAELDGRSATNPWLRFTTVTILCDFHLMEREFGRPKLIQEDWNLAKPKNLLIYIFYVSPIILLLLYISDLLYNWNLKAYHNY